MGFFSFLKPIIKFAAPVIAGALGFEAVSAIVAPESKAEAQDISGLSESAQARVRAGLPGTRTLTREQALAQKTVVPVSGRLRKRTTVETFDPATGTVVRSKTTMGGVAVFAQDVAAAKRIFRQVRKLDARLPRKTVKQGEVKQLTDRVVKNALERAGDRDCPPKC